MQAAEADDEACLAGLMRFMDHIIITGKYKKVKVVPRPWKELHTGQYKLEL